MAQVTITQVKSIIDKPENQKLTMKALGLGKISKSVTVELTPQIAGMVNKVQHLVSVKNL
ncbi:MULTISPECIES: 50S ribosomal protein L30 [Adhaeribacter]|jgi:large subunit ribosomal protein L30|uniref:Large ribosomal subunit protein uL30 n=2 Tax=Adhaeribacter TaxID=299566 RepID=A0ABS1BYR2_9BACT|nr:50S ribosomal protein L30 [Adhaeribacter terrigena]MBK0401420.1 50S ribosomal protein L30 [Adhaeribacter terrigena]